MEAKHTQSAQPDSNRQRRFNGKLKHRVRRRDRENRTTICILKILNTLYLERCRENPSLCADREAEPPGFWTRRI